MRGKIVRWMDDKNFGFIKSDVDGKDYFFHKSACINFVPERNLDVDFEPTEGLKGLRAEQITY